MPEAEMHSFGFNDVWMNFKKFIKVLPCNCRRDKGSPLTNHFEVIESIFSAIENGQIKIVPEVLVSGGSCAADGLMGQLTRLLPGGI